MIQLSKDDIEKNKVNTISQYHILDYLKKNLSIDEFDVYLIDDDNIKVVDKTNDSFIFNYNKLTKEVNPQEKIYASYIRTATSDSVGSIEKQKRLCEIAISKEFGEAAQDNVEVYIDEGFSGKDSERPAFSKLINDVKAGKIKQICVSSANRISRDVESIVSFKDFLSENKVNIISVDGSIDETSGISPEVLKAIQDIMSEEQRLYGDIYSEYETEIDKINDEFMDAHEDELEKLYIEAWDRYQEKMKKRKAEFFDPEREKHFKEVREQYMKEVENSFKDKNSDLEEKDITD